ncbi:hypothetical protein Nepgr_029956 [Nepenthes gracilis]|uniref:Scarecrow-like protein 8 n=1 Tax=Nepenthes gracilis TaxID=150966 RepID=A0AAD3TDJ9_NEPGR|nr:hypothetical protein Nepgr_029956 [Nepenthes gracilis]
MSSGFSGSGGPEFYGGGGSSMASIGNSLRNDNHGQYRFQQQLAGILSDHPSSQIGQRQIDLTGKRSLADFQSYQEIPLQLRQHQEQPPFSLIQQQLRRQQPPLSLLQQQPMELGFYLRSVKQRTNYQNNASPISTLSPPLDIFSPNGNIILEIPSSVSVSSGSRYGSPVCQPLAPNPITLCHVNALHNSLVPTNPPFNPNFSSSGCSTLGPNRAVVAQEQTPESENNSSSKIMDTLQELEKQLLDDNDEDVDAVSVVTNSEWSETLQRLMGPSPAQNNTVFSPSPTSSSSSSSCSYSSAASPPSVKQMISEAAAAISDGTAEASIKILSWLSQVSNSRGNSEQRLAFYMGNALRCRACPNDYPPPVVDLYGKQHIVSSYMLHDLSPCFKFGLLAANTVVLDAITTGNGKVHIVDFDVGHGGKYLNLLRALAQRQSQTGNLDAELKITAVSTEVVRDNNITGNGIEMKSTEVVKNGLMKLAEQVGVVLKFIAVTRTIHELTRESLSCEEDEAVVVNFAFKLYRVPDESVSMENLRDELLRRVKGLRPRVVTLVEQEINCNTAPFLTRVNEALAYYGALLDSLDSTMQKDNPDRLRIEEGLGRKVANAVACEGAERVERCEVFGKWRARMRMAGFELKPLSQSVSESMRSKLNSARGGNPGFTVTEENGGVGFGWMGRTLTVVSAWR